MASRITIDLRTEFEPTDGRRDGSGKIRGDPARESVVRLKLDENIGSRGIEALRAAGHDVATVWEQGLGSGPDPEVIAACSAETRCIVTLDLDFSNPLRFLPEENYGIAVLRLPSRVSSEKLMTGLRTLIGGLETGEIVGKLWIVQAGAIREYRPEG